MSASFDKVPTRAAGSGSVFRRALGRIVSAREKQAQRYINGYLLSLDDETLKAGGFDRKTLSRNGGSSYPF